MTVQVSSAFAPNLISPELAAKLGVPVTEQNFDQFLAGYGIKTTHGGEDGATKRVIQQSRDMGKKGRSFFEPMERPKDVRAINFKDMTANAYLASKSNFSFDRDGNSADSMDWGPKSSLDFKRDGALTQQRPTTTATFGPNDFENGAGTWFPIGDLQGYTLDKIKKIIDSSGSFTITFSDSSATYSYLADQLNYNKMHGVLTVTDSQGNQVYSHEMFWRGKDLDDGSAVTLFSTPTWEYEQGLKSRSIISFYYENVPNASYPGNASKIFDIMKKYVTSQLQLPEPESMLFGWYWNDQSPPIDYHKAIFTVFVDTKKDDSVSVPFVGGNIFSDRYLRDNRPATGLMGGISSANYTDTAKFASNEIFSDHAFGRTDQGNITEPALVATNEITTSVSDRSSAVPKSTYLGKNYPNPFNPETTIPFHLKDSGHVKIEVFNSLGQSVAVLADEQHMAGDHYVRFDGSNLPSGVYVCRLTAAGAQDVAKLMLAK